MPNYRQEIIGINLPDPFFDSYQEETFSCGDILDKVRVTRGQYVTITFDKSFLKKLAQSHIQFIKQMEKIY